jgi:hypothetical protein
MSGKKRRKAKSKSGYRVSAPARPETVEPPARQRTEAPSMLGSLSRGGGDQSLPSIPRALGRGFLTIGSSPVLLVAPFLLLFLSWLGLVALGLEGPPGRLVDLLALPPISTYFDALNGVAIYGFGATGLVVATGFLIVRAVLLSILTGLVVERLEGQRPSKIGVLRGLMAFPTVLAVNVLGLSMLIAASVILPLLGPGLYFLGSLLTLVAALFFFVFAPVAAIRERRGLQETLRRAARAALIPGSWHVLLCFIYLFLTLLILVVLAPGGNFLTVNPSAAMWAYALFCTFVHMGFLAAFAYRWMVAEPNVPEQPVRRRQPARRTR